MMVHSLLAANFLLAKPPNGPELTRAAALAHGHRSARAKSANVPPLHRGDSRVGFSELLGGHDIEKPGCEHHSDGCSH